MQATFGALVRNARMAKGITQAELSAAVGVTRSHIANIETDRTDVPITTLLRIAQALSIDPGELLPKAALSKEGPNHG